jgi:hypothetical protein
MGNVPKVIAGLQKQQMGQNTRWISLNSACYSPQSSVYFASISYFFAPGETLETLPGYIV